MSWTNGLIRYGLACAMVGWATVGEGAYYWKSAEQSGSWTDAACWLTDGGAEAASSPDESADVWFSTSAAPILEGNVKVAALHVAQDAVLTLSGAKTFSLERADGEGTIALEGNAQLSSRSGGGEVKTAVRINDTARLTTGGSDFLINGPLLGTGTVTLFSGGSYKGVRLFGDNSAFAGEVIVDGNSQNRMKFGAAQSGSAQATFRINGGTDNGSMVFNEESTIRFGELLAPNGANIRVNGALHTYEIGGKGTDFDLGKPDFFNANLTKVVKVGSGTMRFAGKNYGTLEVREGVAEWNSTSSSTLPSSKLSFTGGAFRYGEAAGTDDVSALIKDSTAAVRIDTNGKDIRFETPLAASNAGGLEKSGAGCLTLTAAPAAVGSLAVRGGVLAVAAGGTFTSVALAEGCRLEILADPVTWTGGTEQTLLTYASLEDGTELTKDNVIIKGLSDNVTTEISFEDGTVKATVTAEPLVWNGDNGADWSTADVWKGGSSGEPKSFAALDVVRFDGSAFAGASLPETNLVGLASSVEPSAVTVDIPAGFGYKLSGEGLLTTPRFTMNGPGSFVVDCDLALTDLDLNGGVFALSGERAYTLPSPSGAGVLAVDDAASVTFGDQMLSMSEAGYALTGTGTLRLGQGTFTARDSQLENFTGTIDVPTGAVLSDHIVSDTANFGGAKIRLSGGAIDVRAVNLTTDNDIELVEGTESQFFGGNANYKLRGGLSGTGTVVFNTDQRGFQFKGDNSAFAGTAILRGGANYMSLGFYTPSAGSALARWTLDSENGADRDGSWRTLRIEGTRAAEPLHLGAFNVTKAGAMVQCANNPTCLVIGERNEDCAIEGGFNLNRLVLEKTGPATLTLGTNCTMIASSTVTVASGTLEVNATNLVTAVVTVKSGAVLAGGGSVGGVTFEEGSLVSIPDFDPATADRTKTYPGIKAESFSGKSSVAGGAVGNGQWRAVVVDGRICAQYRKSGLLIVVK